MYLQDIYAFLKRELQPKGGKHMRLKQKMEYTSRRNKIFWCPTPDIPQMPRGKGSLRSADKPQTDGGFI